MRYQVGDLFFDTHPDLDHSQRSIIILSLSEKDKEYIVWESINNQILEWDSLSLETDEHLKIVK